MTKLYSYFVLPQMSLIWKSQFKPMYADLEELLSLSFEDAVVKIYGLFSSCTYVTVLFVIEK